MDSMDRYIPTLAAQFHWLSAYHHRVRRRQQNGILARSRLGGNLWRHRFFDEFSGVRSNSRALGKPQFGHSLGDGQPLEHYPPNDWKSCKNDCLLRDSTVNPIVQASSQLSTVDSTVLQHHHLREASDSRQVLQVHLRCTCRCSLALTDLCSVDFSEMSESGWTLLMKIVK